MYTLKEKYNQSLFKETDNYHVLNFKNKNDWKEHRRYFIGGSDASTLIGVNPYKTNNQLWKEKMGLIVPEDISNREAVVYGVELEPFLRATFSIDFKDIYEVEYLEDTMLLSKKHNFMAYSPDGLLIEKATGKKGILEIKTTTIHAYRQREKWDDALPQNYYIQVLHGLLVTGFDFIVLKAQLKSEYNGMMKLETRHYRFDRDEVLDDLRVLEEAELNNYKFYETKTEPPTTLFI